MLLALSAVKETSYLCLYKIIETKTLLLMRLVGTWVELKEKLHMGIPGSISEHF